MLPEQPIIHLGEVPPVTLATQYVSIDTEMFHMDKDKLHRPTTGQLASVQICPDGQNVYIITEEKAVGEALRRIDASTWVFHNAAFDLTQLRRYAPIPPRDKLHDTLIFDRILWSGYYDSWGLRDLARRYFSIYLDKEVREEFIDADTMNDEMLHYAAMDALVTWHLVPKQLQAATREDLHVWNWIDRPAIFAFIDFKGFPFDAEGWGEVARQHQAQADELEAHFDFNPRSPAQVLKALREIGLNRLTSTAEDMLLPYKDVALVQNILAYRAHHKAASTYGTNIIDRYLEADGCIYPAVHTIGAETGRTSCANPNLQNIPNTPEYRSKFIAGKGEVILDADVAAQEPRITLYHSQDKNLRAAIENPDVDVHTAVGRIMFDMPTMEKAHPLRKKAKALNLGLTYGLTAAGLMKKVNEEAATEQDKLSKEEAQDLVDLYFRKFPGVGNYIDEQRRFGSKSGYVQTASGRKLWLNLYSWGWQNNAINHPAQGGGADAIKRAIVRIHQDCLAKNVDYPIIVPVHDEIVERVPNDPDAIKFYSEQLEECVLGESEYIYEGVPFELEISHGESWACKK